MKPTARPRSFLLGSFLLSAPCAHAVTYYWDNNGTGANYGTAAGTWAATTVGSATQGWTTATNGTTAPTGSITTLNTNATTDAVNFGNGTSGLSAGTITVSGTVASGNMTFASGSGAIVLSGGQINFATASTITVNNASDTITSILGGAATSLTKAGTGALLLTGANSYSGQTIVSGGTLNLGGSTATGSLASTVLTLNGGAFHYTRSDSATQTFTTTNINSSSSTISASTGNILNLGTVTRGSGVTFDFSNPAGGIIAALAANNVGGILSGFTVGDSWAVANGAGVAINGLANGSYTLASVAGTAVSGYAGNNIDVDNNAGAVDPNITANSLRFSAGAANTLTLTGTTNVITTGGILVGSAVGSNLSTITGGTLAGANTKDLSVIQNNTSGGLTISSIIGDNTGATALTKSGAGLLTLGGNNTFTGGLFINSGKVVLANAGALRSNAGTENAVTFTAGSTGTLALGGNSVVVKSLSNNGGSPVVENANATPATLTIGNSTNTASTFSGVIRDGTGGGALTLTKSGTNTLTFTGTNSYTGGFNLTDGSVTGANGTLTPFGTGLITISGSNTFITPIRTDSGLGAPGYTFANGMQVNSGAVVSLTNGNQFTSMIVNGVLSGSGTIVHQTGAGGAGGFVTFANTANTFTGPIRINNTGNGNGSVNMSSLLDSPAATTINFGSGANSGILALSVTTPTVFTNRQIVFSGTSTGGGMIQNNGGNAANSITFSQNLSVTGAGAKTLELGGSNTGANAFTGVIGNGSGTISLSKTGAGTWSLSNTANTYTGITTVGAGVLEVTKLAIGGVGNNSSIGASSNAAANLVFNSGGGLRYTGSGDTTDRRFTYNSTTNSTGWNIDASGTGAVNFNNTNTITYTGTADQVRYFTLTGTNTNDNIMAATIGNNGAGAGLVNFTKSGLGKWVLTGTNTYTGGTFLQYGTLELKDAATGHSNVHAGFAFSQGEGTLISNHAGSGTLSTSFTSFTRSVGASGNFVSAGVANGANNKVVVSGLTTGALIDKGIYFGGSSYATCDSSGFVRGYQSGDTNYLAAPTSTTIGSSTASSNVELTTGDITAQTVASANTINLGANNLTMSSGILSVNGILSSGASNAQITGGTLSQTANTAGLDTVVRVNGSSDKLTIGSIIANNTNAQILTKSGDGTLVLSGNNSYTGVTHVNAGTLSIGANIHLGAQATGATLNLKGGTLQATATFGLTNSATPGTNNRAVTLANQSGFDVTASNTLTILGVVSNGTVAGGFTKTGTGTLALSNVNTYTGATAVNAGTLNVTAGNINTTTALTVAAGAKLAYNSSTALAVVPTLNGTGTGAGQRAVLGGTGTIGTSVTLDNTGDVLSPGNSPGIQTYTPAQTWASFSYDWEVNDFSDITGLTAGADFDQIGVSSTLNLTGGTGAYILNVLGLTSGNVSGLVPGFDEIDRSWTILTSTGITGFNAANWTINTAGFTDPDAGLWSLAQDGNNLVLSYTAVPEPRAALLGGLGLLMLLRRRR